MRDMYYLLGCTGGEIGYVYASRDTTCYSTDGESSDPLVFEYRTCATHGYEELLFYAAGGYNTWEAVFHVNDRYYAVKETMQAAPIDVLRCIVTPNTIESGKFQAWAKGQTPCLDPGPLPVPLP
jgi:hypothetical protein